MQHNHYGIVDSTQNDWDIVSHNNTDISHNDNVKWKKSSIVKGITYISINTKLKEQKKKTKKLKSKLWLDVKAWYNQGSDYNKCQDDISFGDEK